MDDITEIIVRMPTQLGHDAEQDIAFVITRSLLGPRSTEERIGAALDKIKFEYPPEIDDEGSAYARVDPDYPDMMIVEYDGDDTQYIARVLDENLTLDVLGPRDEWIAQNKP